jgi:hypothetical protein
MSNHESEMNFTGRAGFIFLLVLSGLFFHSCDDTEIVGGCRTYDHIFEDYIGIGGLEGMDTIQVFFAAYDERETAADIVFIYHEASWLDDSLMVELNVYGESYESTPDPRSRIIQRSDSSITWYSAGLFQESYLSCLTRPVLKSAPCMPPYYRVDYVTIYHPDDVTVIGHEKIVVPYQFCGESGSYWRTED